MSNNHVSETLARANAEPERLNSASINRGSGLIRIADRFFKRKQIAEAEIARHEKEVAEVQAAFLALRAEHARHIRAVTDIRDQIANAEQTLANMREKRVEPAEKCFYKITSPSQPGCDVLKWSRDLNDIDTAIVRCEDIIEQLRAELPLKESALAQFERKHADDLAPVEAEAP